MKSKKAKLDAHYEDKWVAVSVSLHNQDVPRVYQEYTKSVARCHHFFVHLWSCLIQRSQAIPLALAGSLGSSQSAVLTAASDRCNETVGGGAATVCMSHVKIACRNIVEACRRYFQPLPRFKIYFNTTWILKTSRKKGAQPAFSQHSEQTALS